MSILFIFLFLALGVLGLLIFLHALTSFLGKYSVDAVKQNGKFKGVKTPEGSVDVLIVGAGPAGATTAWYLKQQRQGGVDGKSGLRVTMVDRAKFPRFKPCGDAWCHPALNLLEEMDILKDIEASGKYRAVQRGGFVSPFGYSCVGGPYGSVSKCKTYAIKRIIADEYLTKAAQKQGAVLEENAEVKDYEFDEKAGLWNVRCLDGRSFSARVLVVADGSPNFTAKKLGLVKTDEMGYCTNQYIKGHQWKDDDGVMFFNSSLLPGYSALFRHYNDDMYLGSYVLPGGKATSRVIDKYEKEMISQYPYFTQAFGKDWKHQEGFRPRVAPIRIGGIVKSFASHLLVVGDAAGQVDPLTGEGIHTAMIAGKLAAQTIAEMFENGDFSEDSTRVYHQRWMGAFGYDFKWSSGAARVIYKFPILLDAVCVYGERRGQAFLDEFGEIMTGVKPKSEFLKLKYTIPLTFELIKQVFIQYILRKKPKVPYSIGQDVVNKYGVDASKKRAVSNE